MLINNVHRKVWVIYILISEDGCYFNDVYYYFYIVTFIAVINHIIFICLPSLGK